MANKDQAYLADGGNYSLGATLRQLRQNKGLSLRQLAAESNVHYSWLAKVENGDLKSFPNSLRLVRLATALDVAPAELLTAAGVPAEIVLPRFDFYLRHRYALPAEPIGQLEALLAYLLATHQQPEDPPNEHHAA
jgi:transcriptional regulator with XRE-family HTH domain